MGFFEKIRETLGGGSGGWKETLENARKEDGRKLGEAEEKLLKIHAEHEAAKERLLSAFRNGDKVDAEKISELRRKIENHE